MLFITICHTREYKLCVSFIYNTGVSPYTHMCMCEERHVFVQYSMVEIGKGESLNGSIQ